MLESETYRSYENQTDLEELSVNPFLSHSKGLSLAQFYSQTDENAAMMVTMELLWSVFYWLTFINCYLCLPFLQEYVVAGEFTVLGRSKRAIINNLLFYAVCSAFGICFLLYMYWKDAFAKVSFRGFVIALSNAWGLFLLILFLSQGVVQVPRLFLQRMNLGKVLD